MQKVVDFLAKIVNKGQVIKFYADLAIQFIDGVGKWLVENAPNQPKK
ncbi:hypothetical protein [Elizabethkingia anophelis]